jgi:hypothetical protein
MNKNEKILKKYEKKIKSEKDNGTIFMFKKNKN